MNRDEIDECISSSKDAPYRVDKVKDILNQVDGCFTNELTKELFYDLASMVVELGNRVKELEYHKLLKENMWAEAQRRRDKERDKLSVWRDSLLPSDGESGDRQPPLKD